MSETKAGIRRRTERELIRDLQFAGLSNEIECRIVWISAEGNGLHDNAARLAHKLRKAFPHWQIRRRSIVVPEVLPLGDLMALMNHWRPDLIVTHTESLSGRGRHSMLVSEETQGQSDQGERAQVFELKDYTDAEQLILEAGRSNVRITGRNSEARRRPQDSARSSLRAFTGESDYAANNPARIPWIQRVAVLLDAHHSYDHLIDTVLTRNWPLNTEIVLILLATEQELSGSRDQGRSASEVRDPNSAIATLLTLEHRVRRKHAMVRTLLYRLSEPEASSGSGPRRSPNSGPRPPAQVIPATGIPATGVDSGERASAEGLTTAEGRAFLARGASMRRSNRNGVLRSDRVLRSTDTTRRLPSMPLPTLVAPTQPDTTERSATTLRGLLEQNADCVLVTWPGATDSGSAQTLIRSLINDPPIAIEIVSRRRAFPQSANA